jgi:DNA processing protein
MQIEEKGSYEAKVYQVALSLVPGVGNALAKMLVSYCGSAEAVFRSKAHQLHKIPGIGSKISTSIRNHNVLETAVQEVERCQQKGIQLLTYTDAAYPHRLKQIYDAPAVLYYKGHTNLNAQKIISIVGTRSATSYGREVIEQLMSGLAKHQALIVSGLAYGIDIYAHRMALEHKLDTIGVLANGLDIIYPAVHKKTALEMLEQGGLVSEIKPGVPPEAHYFPARNRIIAGMADATIVVEAAASGGALITANLANDYDREVFAVPGNVYQTYSQGCNKLIKSHKAHILTSIADLEYIMNWDLEVTLPSPSAALPDMTGLPETERKVLQLLLTQEQGMLTDEISWKTQIPIHQLASCLLNLECNGWVKALPGRKYKVGKR